ncbi:DUF2129 domain-containing protein [Staphylococcus sp. 11261D007BR]
MNIIQREKIIIYLKSMKHERHIRKYGHITYSNSKDKYVTMYITKDKLDETIQKLMKLKYVIDIEGSPYKNLKKVYEKEQNDWIH